MYREFIKKDNVALQKKDFSKQLHRICKVDQFSAQPFNMGNFGWSRNSISAMANATNYQEFLSIAQAIAKSPRQFNLPDKCSYKDALALCRPRNAQSPYELELFAKQLAENDMRNLSEQYMKNIQNTANVREVSDSNVQNTVEDEK